MKKVLLILPQKVKCEDKPYGGLTEKEISKNTLIGAAKVSEVSTMDT